MSGWKYKRKHPYEPYNKETVTNAKTTKQLQEELKRFEDGLSEMRIRYSQKDNMVIAATPFYTNHIAYLKMKIAERIGKKQ